MKKTALLIALVLFTISLIVPSVFAIDRLPNIFNPDDRVTAASETDINPWDILTWKSAGSSKCPEKDSDYHMVMENPDPNGKIKRVEIVIGSGAVLPFGTLCSYSFVDNGKLRMFIYDIDNDVYVEYLGEGKHSLYINKVTE